jgi:hypothetical protein
LKLHDIALVEVNPAGYKKQIQIIRMTTDLLDPSATTLTIGSFIPNIIYIDRQTNESATGNRGGGGGGSNSSKQTQRSEFETKIEKNNRMIRLRAYQNDLDDLDNEVKVQEARITVEADRITAEVTDRRTADQTLSSKITQTADSINLEVSKKVGKNEVISAINLTSESATIKASRINLEGYVTTSMMESSFSSIDQTTIRILTNSYQAYFNGTTHINGTFMVGTNTATWQQKQVGTSLTVTSTGGNVTAVDLNKTTIHYLGYS